MKKIFVIESNLDVINETSIFEALRHKYDEEGHWWPGDFILNVSEIPTVENPEADAVLAWDSGPQKISKFVAI